MCLNRNELLLISNKQTLDDFKLISYRNCVDGLNFRFLKRNNIFEEHVKLLDGRQESKNR